MGLLLMLFLLHLLICTVVLLLGIGLGYLLRWLWPGMEIGFAILIGVVINAVSILIIWSTASATSELPAGAVDAEEEEPPPVLYALPPFPVNRRTKRRRRQ